MTRGRVGRRVRLQKGLQPAHQTWLREALQKVQNHPGGQDHGQRTEQCPQLCLGIHGGQRRPRATQGGPEEADQEQSAKTEQLAGGVAGVRVTDHLHVTDGAAEGPAQHAKQAEIGDLAPPVFAPGEQADRDGRQCPWEHGPGLVSVITADPPADRE